MVSNGDGEGQRCKKWEILEIYLCYFLAGANFWAILGHFWAILAILGHFWAILSHFGSFLGHFLVLIFFGQKFISAIFITFCISDTSLGKGVTSAAVTERDPGAWEIVAPGSSCPGHAAAVEKYLFF